MILQEDLDAAVAQGIIDQAQAVRLSHLARLRLEAAPIRPDVGDPTRIDPDDERFRLIGGFNDVFVGIGVVLLCGAIFGLARILGFGDAFAFTAVLAAWGLSEVFARRMRLALPSILLAAMFAGTTGLLVALLIGGDPPSSPQHFGVASGLAIAAAALLHHWRFRVPIDIVIATAGMLGAILIGLYTIQPGMVERFLDPILVVSGLSVFGFALRLDMGDPQRRTRWSDAAFWLHLMAAGLIVHPIFRGLVGGLGTAQALAILAMFVVLGLVALVIDRRALLVSALSYAGFALAYLITQNVSASLALPLALLALAALVLALSAGWRSLRGALLPRLPLGRLRERLPPIDVLPA